jgi:hypothetical protein
MGMLARLPGLDVKPDDRRLLVSACAGREKPDV